MFLDYGFKNLKNEIPELKIAITSVLFASFEVNQITDKKRKIGNKRFAKYVATNITHIMKKLIDIVFKCSIFFCFINYFIFF